MPRKSKMNKSNPSNLRDIIHQVTAEKLQKLQAQKNTLNTHYDPVLENAEKQVNPLHTLKDLQKALKESPIKDAENDHLDSQLKDLEVLIQLAEKDVASGACDQIVQHWIKKLTQEIKFILQRCEYSYLYGSIMNEYLDRSGKEETVEEVVEDPRDTKEATMQELTDRIFVAPENFDKDKFRDFLSNIVFKFDDYDDLKFMEGFQKKTTKFAEYLSKNLIVQCVDLKHCIKGLYSVDLLSEEKKSTLRELEQNSVAQEELATLLTDRLRNFATWNWPAPVPIDFRRNMAGKYRAFMDEDIVTALFLQFVGVKWAVHFKQMFLAMYNNDKLWKRNSPYYKSHQTDSIEFCRRKIHAESFLAVLPGKISEQYSSYDAENGTADDSKDKTKSPMYVKQRLLHVISNEIHLNKVIRPESPITIVQTDMEWFGPSLAHESILVLMEVLGVSTEWLDFFKRFLQAPLIVTANSEPKTRQKGVAISHMLSTLFGESLLFVLDFYVNNKSGILLHRVHDDFWLWDHRQDQTVQAWKAIEEYTKIAGLKLNMDKSGSVIVTSTTTDTKQATFGQAPLPQKEIKWGFLQLYSDGIFRINLENLKPHVEEMSRILNQAQTVVDWVNTHNKYFSFFIRNFGECALTLGTQHIDQIMNAIQLITSQVFEKTNGSPIKALQSKFQNLSRPDLLDAWIYWPVAFGGLGLKNYLLQMISLIKTYKSREEDSRFTLLPEQDRSVWKAWVQKSYANRSKSKWSKRPPGTVEGQVETVTDSEFSDTDENDFADEPMKKRKKRQINFEQVCLKYREFRWGHWKSKYETLLQSPEVDSPSLTNNHDNKDQWLLALYGPRLVEYFGSEDFINTKLIPVSLISIMQASRVKY